MKLLRALTLPLFLTMAMAQPSSPEFDVRVWQFQRHWNKFLRSYWGCSAQDTSRLTCNATLSMMDMREFAAAQREAQRLFELR
jgi:hypothetical protein